LTRPRRGWLIFFVASAAPGAFGAEFAARKFLLSPDFEVARRHLEPKLTPVAWGLLAASVPASALGFVVHRRLLRRPGEDRTRIEVGAFLLASSIPQVPALLATVGALLGAALLPVVATLGVTTVAVALQGIRRYNPTP
jgi:hypothetical protein